MGDRLQIVLIAGSTRVGRVSIHAARLVEAVGAEFPEIEITFVDVNDYFPLPGEGNDPESRDARWIEINKKADGYYIVSPEYNHSFPGSLKMLLDNEYENFRHKPVTIAGVSSGPFGGARMIESLIHPLRKMAMVVTNSDVHFPFAQNFFDPEKQTAEELEKQKERIRKAYRELIWMAKTLKWGRENL